MKIVCPFACHSHISSSEDRRIVRFGHFYRKSDARSIQRYRCLNCKKSFSLATTHPCFRQNKRHLNHRLYELLCSAVSQRRSARLLHISRTTVSRKLKFLASQARIQIDKNLATHSPSLDVQFDDLETFEHTKCKPLSVTLAVESESRKILGFIVSKMPAKGHLAAIARKKYGFRRDERARGRKILFKKICPLIHPLAVIKSDENPHYPSDVAKFFPRSTYQRFKGKRGCIVGQGELKKIGFDPLFSLNHTCAKLRADINRLVRRTWCTTKKPECLSDHLVLYMLYHNTQLALKSQK